MIRPTKTLFYCDVPQVIEARDDHRWQRLSKKRFMGCGYIYPKSPVL